MCRSEASGNCSSGHAADRHRKARARGLGHRLRDLGSVGLAGGKTPGVSARGLGQNNANGTLAARTWIALRLREPGTQLRERRAGVRRRASVPRLTGVSYQGDLKVGQRLLEEILELRAHVARQLLDRLAQARDVTANIVVLNLAGSPSRSISPHRAWLQAREPAQTNDVGARPSS